MNTDEQIARACNCSDDEVFLICYYNRLYGADCEDRSLYREGFKFIRIMMANHEYMLMKSAQYEEIWDKVSKFTSRSIFPSWWSRLP